MKNKIQWYKEVLELEPSSRVFFPFAKLLADNGRNAEALAVLRQGLERHPEHIEAKLLLVDVLHRQGGKEELEEMRSQVLSLTGKMTNYPAFWQAWASILASDGEQHDSAVAVNFLAAQFGGNAITWTDVISRGLAAVLSGDGEAATKAGKPSPAAAESESMEKPLEKALEGVAEALAEDVEENAGDFEGEALVDEDEEMDYDPDSEESFSLRTRTMANLLAEQGDYEGALDIYQELLDNAPDGPVKDEISTIIEMMRMEMDDSSAEKKGKGKASKAGKSGGQKAKAFGGKKKLINTLESLAQRLEARATG